MHGQGFNPLVLVAAFNVLAIFAACYFGLRTMRK